MAGSNSLKLRPLPLELQHQRKIEITSTPPLTTKKYIVNNDRASKNNVTSTSQSLLPDTFSPQHVSTPSMPHLPPPPPPPPRRSLWRQPIQQSRASKHSTGASYFSEAFTPDFSLSRSSTTEPRQGTKRMRLNDAAVPVEDGTQSSHSKRNNNAYNNSQNNQSSNNSDPAKRRKFSADSVLSVEAGSKTMFDLQHPGNRVTTNKSIRVPRNGPVLADKGTLARREPVSNKDTKFGDIDLIMNRNLTALIRPALIARNSLNLDIYPPSTHWKIGTPRPATSNLNTSVVAPQTPISSISPQAPSANLPCSATTQSPSDLLSHDQRDEIFVLREELDRTSLWLGQTTTDKQALEKKNKELKSEVRRKNRDLALVNRSHQQAQKDLYLTRKANEKLWEQLQTQEIWKSNMLDRVAQMDELLGGIRDVAKDETVTQAMGPQRAEEALLVSLNRLQLHIVVLVNDRTMMTRGARGGNCRTLLDLENRVKSYTRSLLEKNGMTWERDFVCFKVEISHTIVGLTRVWKPSEYANWITRKATQYMSVSQQAPFKIQAQFEVSPSHFAAMLNGNTFDDPDQKDDDDTITDPAHDSESSDSDSDGNSGSIPANFKNPPLLNARQSHAFHASLANSLSIPLTPWPKSQLKHISRHFLPPKPSRFAIKLDPGSGRVLLPEVSAEDMPERVQDRTWRSRTVEELRVLPEYGGLEGEMRRIEEGKAEVEESESESEDGEGDGEGMEESEEEAEEERLIVVSSARTPRAAKGAGEAKRRAAAAKDGKEF